MRSHMKRIRPHSQQMEQDMDEEQEEHQYEKLDGHMQTLDIRLSSARLSLKDDFNDSGLSSLEGSMNRRRSRSWRSSKSRKSKQSSRRSSIDDWSLERQSGDNSELAGKEFLFLPSIVSSSSSSASSQSGSRTKKSTSSRFLAWARNITGI